MWSSPSTDRSARSGASSTSSCGAGGQERRCCSGFSATTRCAPSRSSPAMSKSSSAKPLTPTFSAQERSRLLPSPERAGVQVLTGCAHSFPREAAPDNGPKKRGVMNPRMQLGDYLVAYLRKVGVTHLFGIPGDLVIQLFMKFGQPRHMQVMTFSHEPGAGFAVDGYARATGKIGVLCVTYGAGGHNVVNPVAGSFSERVPILVISGGPGEEERKLGTLIHHQAKEIESQLRIYRELTCAARVIDDAATAAASVDEVVRTVWREQRPGYVEIHRDMVERPIPVPRAIIEWDGALHFGRSDERRVDEAVRETVQRFNAARRPLTMIGIEPFRYKLQKDIRALAERMGAPVTTTVLGKGAFPMDHPLFMGVHIGPISPPPIVKRVDRADLVLNLGTLLTDMNLGSRPPQITRDR